MLNFDEWLIEKISGREIHRQRLLEKQSRKHFACLINSPNPCEVAIGRLGEALAGISSEPPLAVLNLVTEQTTSNLCKASKPTNPNFESSGTGAMGVTTYGSIHNPISTKHRSKFALSPSPGRPALRTGNDNTVWFLRDAREAAFLTTPASLIPAAELSPLTQPPCGMKATGTSMVGYAEHTPALWAIGERTSMSASMQLRVEESICAFPVHPSLMTGKGSFRLAKEMPRTARIQQILARLGSCAEIVTYKVDPSLLVHGHEDLTYAAVLAFKRARFTTSEEPEHSKTVTAEGCSIHRGFPYMPHVMEGVENSNIVPPLQRTASWTTYDRTARDWNMVFNHGTSSRIQLMDLVPTVRKPGPSHLHPERGEPTIGLPKPPLPRPRMTAAIEPSETAAFDPSKVRYPTPEMEAEVIQPNGQTLMKIATGKSRAGDMNLEMGAAHPRAKGEGSDAAKKA